MELLGTCHCKNAVSPMSSENGVIHLTLSNNRNGQPTS